jgi:hypothetical protein
VLRTDGSLLANLYFHFFFLTLYFDGVDDAVVFLDGPKELFGPIFEDISDVAIMFSTHGLHGLYFITLQVIFIQSILRLEGSSHFVIFVMLKDTFR